MTLAAVLVVYAAVCGLGLAFGILVYDVVDGSRELARARQQLKRDDV